MSPVVPLCVSVLVSALVSASVDSVLVPESLELSSLLLVSCVSPVVPISSLPDSLAGSLAQAATQVKQHRPKVGIRSIEVMLGK